MSEVSNCGNAAIPIHPPKRPSFEEEHSSNVDGKPNTPDRHHGRPPTGHAEASSIHETFPELRLLQRNSSEKSIERSERLLLHHTSDRSLGHSVEFQPLMQLPPPYLYTCTVGRNRSGARYPPVGVLACVFRAQL